MRLSLLLHLLINTCPPRGSNCKPGVSWVPVGAATGFVSAGADSSPPPSPVPWRNPAQVTSSFCVPASRVRETGSHRRDLARRAAERGTQCRRCESIVPARARKAARRGRKRGLEQPMHPPAGRGCYSIPRQRDVPAPQPRRDSFFSSKTETATHVLRDLVVCCKDKVAFLVCERTSETNAM